MGSFSLHKYPKVCPVSANSERGCTSCQFFFSLFDRLADIYFEVIISLPCGNIVEILNFLDDIFSGNAPLTAVQLLWVNMIMDTLGALALATEPPTDDLMKRLPVGRKGNFISNVMWRNIIGQSLYQFVIIWYLQTRGQALFHLDGPDSGLILNTLIFNAFVFCQVICLPKFFTFLQMPDRLIFYI